MGSSLFLSGGVQQTDQLIQTVSRAHSFSIGDAVRFDVSSGTYQKAQANAPLNAEVVGIVCNIAPGEFSMITSGKIDLTSVSSMQGVTSSVLFLSAVTPGKLEANPPSTIGSIIKPILIRNETSQEYIVNNFLGTQIGGSSTVAIDEIHPVGTIMPYAATDLPDTWLRCNGATYALSAYPELYAATRFASGDRAPIYGHVVEIVIPASSYSDDDWKNAVAGDIVYINNRTTTASASNPSSASANHELVGKILLTTYNGTSSPTTTRLSQFSNSHGWVVQILGKYNSSSKTFEQQNNTVKEYIGSYYSKAKVYAGPNFGGTQRSATSTGANLYSTSIIAFNVPDLRGRFPLGVNSSALAEGESESDSAYTSAITGYTLGSFGGEEKHTLTVEEMPSHTHTYKDYGGTVTTTTADLVSNASGQYTDTPTSSIGGNASHNNMPPYLTVQYIIKAKPYTRAAIIDGVDLPYNKLLIRDLRTRNIGGTNSDLLFHTNVVGDDGTGTLRMRLTSGGSLGIGTSSVPDSVLEVRNPVYSVQISGITGNNSNLGIVQETDFTTGLTYASSATQHTSGLFWKDSYDVRYTKPLAGIFCSSNWSSGSGIHFGTSETYASGIDKIPLSIINGNIGIGNQTPSNKLHIRFAQNNSATVFAAASSSTVDGILIENIDQTPASGNKCRLTMATRSSGAGGNAYSSYISLTAVHGIADQTNLYIGSEYYGSGIAGQSTNPIMYIGGSSGRVGIGTDSPTVALGVSGGINATSTITATSDITTSGKFVGNGTIPIGGIIMWSGTSIPTGWALCNGQTVNSIVTPNLSGRFIVGEGTGYNRNTTGGSDVTTLTVANLPPHRHRFSMAAPSDKNGLAYLGQNVNIVYHGAPNELEQQGGPEGVRLGHWSADTAVAGSGTAFSRLPPYYVLAYIMRVA